MKKQLQSTTSNIAVANNILDDVIDATEQVAQDPTTVENEALKKQLATMAKEISQLKKKLSELADGTKADWTKDYMEEYKRSRRRRAEEYADEYKPSGFWISVCKDKEYSSVSVSSTARVQWN